MEDMHKQAQAAMQEGQEKIKEATHQGQQTFREGRRQLNEVGSCIEHQIEDNPWPIMTGVAVGCLFLGFIMGTKAHS